MQEERKHGWQLPMPPRRPKEEKPVEEICLYVCKCKKRFNDEVQIQQHASTCEDMFDKYGAFI